MKKLSLLPTVSIAVSAALAFGVGLLSATPAQAYNYNVCEQKATCSGSTPVYVSTSNTCRGCASNSECGTSSANGTVLVCLGNGACRGKASCSGSSPIYVSSNNTCRGAQSDSECSTYFASTPYYVNGGCHQCTGDGHCTSRSAARCVSNSCTACSTNSQCTKFNTGNGASNYCMSGNCVTQRSCSKPTPVWMSTNNGCRAVNSSAECTSYYGSSYVWYNSTCVAKASCSGSTPVYVSTNNGCRAPSSNSECASYTPSKPYYASSACRQCTQNSHCGTGNSTYVCSNYSCVTKTTCSKPRPVYVAGNNGCRAVNSSAECSNYYGSSYVWYNNACVAKASCSGTKPYYVSGNNGCRGPQNTSECSEVYGSSNGVWSGSSCVQCVGNNNCYSGNGGTYICRSNSCIRKADCYWPNSYYVDASNTCRGPQNESECNSTYNGSTHWNGSSCTYCSKYWYNNSCVECRTSSDCSTNYSCSGGSCYYDPPASSNSGSSNSGSYYSGNY